MNYFTDEEKKRVNEFLQEKNKSLWIYGLPGCGKTTLAKEILKNTLITRIDSSDLRKHKDIHQYLLDSVQRKNITLMFHQKKERSVLIDDLDTFHKNDSKSLKGLLKFIKEGEFYNASVIVVFHKLFRKHRSIQRISHYDLHLNYCLSTYYQLVNDFIHKKKYKCSSDEIDILIYHSKYNLHKLGRLLEDKSKSKKNIYNYDTFDSVEELTRKVFQNDYKIKDLLTLVEGDDMVVGLNLLESLPKYLDKEKMSHDLSVIYENFVDSDRIDTFMTTHHYWEFRPYFSLLSVGNQRYINKEKVKDNNIPYNKYISKSLNLAQRNNQDATEEKNTCEILMHLYQLVTNDKEALTQYEPKFLKKYAKLFQYFYEIPLCDSN